MLAEIPMPIKKADVPSKDKDVNQKEEGQPSQHPPADP